MTAPAEPDELDDLRVVLDDVATAHADGTPAAQWTAFETLGLTLVGADEQVGGGGGTLAHALEIAAAAGRHGLPLPLPETAVVASWLLDRAGITIPPGPLTVAGLGRAQRLAARPTPEGRLHLLGGADGVPWARAAAHLVVVAEAVDDPGTLRVAVVEPDAVGLTPGENLAGEPRDDLVLDGAAVTWASLPAEVTLDAVRARAAVARSAQILGALERTRDLTLEFVQQRRQFGRPIVRFQAVAQSVAVLAAEVALARAGVTRCRAGERPGGAAAWEFACGAAKVTASRAAATVAATAHQLHGAIGITAEYPLHRFTTRLLAWQDDDGTEEEWAAALGRSLPRLGPDPWAALTAGEAR